MSSQPLLTGAFLSQRLVAAVEEVMELARATVIQYEQESTQIRRENQLLRSKLGEVSAGLPPEANENSPDWDDWTSSLTQQHQQHQQHQGSDDLDLDLDLAYHQQQDLSGVGQDPGQSEQQGVTFDPAPPDPPTALLTSCITVKTEWASDTPELNSQSQPSRASDVMTEFLLTRAIIKEESEEASLSAELQPVAVETVHIQHHGPPVAELDSVAMETVHFDQRRRADCSVSPPRVTSCTAGLQTTGGAKPNASHLHASQRASVSLQPPHPTPRPPHPVAGAQCSSHLLPPGGALLSHNPAAAAARQRLPLFTAPGRVPPALPPQRHRGNPAAATSPSSSSAAAAAVARGHHPKARCVAVSFPCQQCGKLFVHRSRLKVHMLIHTGEKPYACLRCGKRFNNDGTLKNHQRVHTQLRLHSCTLCAMRFKDAYTCRKHLATHTRRAQQAQDLTHNTHNTHTLNTHTRRAQAQDLTHNTHNTHTLNTHTRRAQQAQDLTHNTHNTHTPNTHNTHNTHTPRAQGQMDASHTRQEQLNSDAFMTHTGVGVVPSHTHTHTQKTALWSEPRTGAGGQGQRSEVS